jgi:hypothetical protein
MFGLRWLLTFAVTPRYVLLLLFFQATQCKLPQVSQTLQHVAIVGLGSARFWLLGQGQHLEIALVFAPLFLVYLHHPRACSIIPHIGFLVPAPLDRRGWANLSVVDEELGCMLEGIIACLLWLPWRTITILTWALIARAWGLHPCPTWSSLSPCALVARPCGPLSLWISIALCRGACPLPGWRLAQLQGTAMWRQ